MYIVWIFLLLILVLFIYLIISMVFNGDSVIDSADEYEEIKPSELGLDEKKKKNN
jgi:hypothetical protein